MLIMIGEEGEWNETELTPEIQAQIDSGALYRCNACDWYGDGMESYHRAAPAAER